MKGSAHHGKRVPFAHSRFQGMVGEVTVYFTLPVFSVEFMQAHTQGLGIAGVTVKTTYFIVQKQ